MSKVINKVTDLLKDLDFNNQEIKEVEDRIEKRSLSRLLVSLRAKEGLNQTALAKRLKVNQSYISRIENSTDDKISIEDFNRIVASYGYEVSLNIHKPMTLARKIIRSYQNFLGLIEDFQKLEREDEKILSGMVEFQLTAMKNITRLNEILLESTESKMKKLETMSDPEICIEGVAYNNTMTKELTF